MGASGKVNSTPAMVTHIALGLSVILCVTSTGLFVYSFFKLLALEDRFVSREQYSIDFNVLQTQYDKALQVLQKRVTSLEKLLEVIPEETKQTAAVKVKERMRRDENTYDSGQTFRLTLDEILKLRGPPGQDGKDGKDGEDGKDGKDGQDGNDVRSGVSYVRWGRQDCPANRRLIMRGMGAGTIHNYVGGAAEYLCLPLEPDYPTKAPAPNPHYKAWLTTIEFDNPSSTAFGKTLHNHNLGCAICEATTRHQKLMLPAKWSCPSGWTSEYKGYLMTAPSTEKLRDGRIRRTEFICVDQNSSPLAGFGADGNGAIINHVVADCRNHPFVSLGRCPPYLGNIVLSCIVCTK